MQPSVSWGRRPYEVVLKEVLATPIAPGCVLLFRIRLAKAARVEGRLAGQDLDPKTRSLDASFTNQQGFS